MNEIRELPSGWVKIKLHDAVDVLDDLRKPINSDEREKRVSGKQESELFPYYGATGQVGWIDEFLTDGEYVLVGEDGAPFLDYCKPKAYTIRGKAWVNNHAHILSFMKGLTINAFILHFLNQFNYNGYVNGTTRLKLTKSSLIEIPYPLPPLPEQHRIVTKIEELFSSLDKGIENLKTAKQQLKVYRQAVLKWAFEGRLTNENVVDGELPEGWAWIKLGDMSEMCLGKMLDKKKNRGELRPYLRNISVRWGAFDLSCLETMRFEEHENERYGLKKGDLVICEGGEPGRCAIWMSNEPKYIQKALHRVRMYKGFDTNYIFYFIVFSALNGHLEKYFTGTTIKHLTGKELKKVIFPIPPAFKEQQSIVAEIESRLSVCDKIEESIEQSLRQAESLRQSILKKAFEGKLVPQDPNDEPASVLLARIKVERENDKVEKPPWPRQSKTARTKKAQPL